LTGFFLGLEIGSDGVSEMRRLIARSIAEDVDTYSEAMLGRPNEEYQSWILKNESWGGGIELSILSKFYNIEIDVVDIQSSSISRFGEDRNYPTRIFLLYDGIHYDSLYMEIYDVSC
jgi:ubiquitin thioesterase OTU1